MKLENIMRVEILNRNFSIKDGIKSASRTKKRKLLVFDISKTILYISCTVNRESIKTVDKETAELQLTISLTAAC